MSSPGSGSMSTLTPRSSARGSTSASPLMKIAMALSLAMPSTGPPGSVEMVPTPSAAARRIHFFVYSMRIRRKAGSGSIQEGW